MKRQGTVFDIERFATKDGPGIRTVVFMKGCNMRCAWCHNPEGLSFWQELLYDLRRCIGCGSCAEACPSGAHIMAEGAHIIDRSLCNGCMQCVNVCCSGALQTVGKEYEVDELMRVLLQDAPYFKRSGGGVTISGGEPLCQTEFVLLMLQALRAAKVHTALETNLSIDWARLEPVLEYVDLLMFDLKHIDDAQHRLHTGAPLTPVLENARRVAAVGRTAIVRTPVVPGVNDEIEIIRGVAAFLRETFGKQLSYYELLTYHPLGTDKALKLGMRERGRSLSAPEKQRIHELARAAAAEGLPVRVDGAVWQEEIR